MGDNEDLPALFFFLTAGERGLYGDLLTEAYHIGVVKTAGFSKAR